MNLTRNRSEPMPNSISVQTGLRCVLSPATAILVLAACSQVTIGAGSVIIDDFFGPVGGQTISQDGIGTISSFYSNGDPGLLGGSRFMSLAVTADAGSIAIGSANGSVLDKLVYENGSGVYSILQLSYNANGVGLGQDWSNLGLMSFLVDSADQNGTAIIELFQGINYNGLAFATHTTAIPPISTLNTQFLVPFSAFATAGGFSFADIGSIRISIEGPEGYDMVLHTISADPVPEASTVVPLVGFAVVGFGTWFARRRAAAR